MDTTLKLQSPKGPGFKARETERRPYSAKRAAAQKATVQKGKGDTAEASESIPVSASSPAQVQTKFSWSSIGDLKAFSLYGPRFSSDDYVQEGTCVLRTSDINESGKVDIKSAPRLNLTEEDFQRYALRPGDILITRTGSLGRVAVFNDDVPAIAGAYLIQYRFNAPLATSWFIFHFLKSPAGQKYLIGKGAGVGRPNLNVPTIDSLRIPIPPLPEQRRIVAEIEKQFTRLDAGIAALRNVQAKLKRYRAAVLKAACEGKLVPTEAEIAESESRQFESGAELLKKCGKFRNDGTGRKATALNLQQCSFVPNGWSVASFNQITINYDGRRVPLKAADRDKRSGRYPYYGASGIIDDIDDFLFEGDYLLVAEDGANLLSRSTPIAFMAKGKFWVNNHAHIVQARGGIQLAYLSIVLNGKDIARWVTGTAQPKLTQAALNNISIPLPPLAEQKRIAAEVERRLSVVEELEAAVSANLQRAARLRQSILQRAFS